MMKSISRIPMKKMKPTKFTIEVQNMTSGTLSATLVFKAHQRGAILVKGTCVSNFVSIQSDRGVSLRKRPLWMGLLASSFSSNAPSVIGCTFAVTTVCSVCFSCSRHQRTGLLIVRWTIEAVSSKRGMCAHGSD